MTLFGAAGVRFHTPPVQLSGAVVFVLSLSTLGRMVAPRPVFPFVQRCSLRSSRLLMTPSRFASTSRSATGDVRLISRRASSCSNSMHSVLRLLLPQNTPDGRVSTRARSVALTWHGRLAHAFTAASRFFEFSRWRGELHGRGAHATFYSRAVARLQCPQTGRVQPIHSARGLRHERRQVRRRA